MKTPERPSTFLVPEHEDDIGESSITAATGNPNTMESGFDSLCRDYLEDMRQMKDLHFSFKSWATQEFNKKKISRADYDIFAELNNRLAENIIKIETRTTTLKQLSPALENKKIAESIKNISETVKEIKPRNEPSYAEMLQLPATVKPARSEGNKQMKIQPKEEIVIIKPAEVEGDEAEASKTTKSSIKSEMSKHRNLKVKKSVNIKGGGVLLVLDSEKDKKKIMESDIIKSGKFNVSEPKKKKPKIIIYDVPSDLEDKEVVRDVYLKNYSGKFTESEMTLGFKPLFKVGPKNKETVHWVVECEPVVRRALINDGRVYIELSSCRIRDYIVATRCFHCQQHYHVTKYCKQQNATCAHCSLDHDVKECPNLNSKPSCANCKRESKPFEHKASDPSCPCHMKAVQQIIDQTNYGVAA